MQYRIRIEDRSQRPGRVSLWAASVIMTTLRAALRAEAKAMMTRNATRIKATRPQRESMELSLVRIEDGSGTLVLEPAVHTEPDVPDKVFKDIIFEAQRNEEPHRNTEIQKALLHLKVLFSRDSPIEWIEFIDGNGSCGRFDGTAIERIRSNLLEPEMSESAPRSREVVGRLLELDLSKHTFQIHTVHDRPDTISFTAPMESIIKDLPEHFVVARIAVTPSGTKELLSLEPIDSAPESHFFGSTGLEQIAAEQRVSALWNPAELEIPDAEGVPLEDFIKFRLEKMQ